MLISNDDCSLQLQCAKLYLYLALVKFFENSYISNNSFLTTLKNSLVYKILKVETECFSFSVAKSKSRLRFTIVFLSYLAHSFWPLSMFLLSGQIINFF